MYLCSVRSWKDAALRPSLAREKLVGIQSGNWIFKLKNISKLTYCTLYNTDIGGEGWLLFGALGHFFLFVIFCVKVVFSFLKEPIHEKQNFLSSNRKEFRFRENLIAVSQISTPTANSYSQSRQSARLSLQSSELAPPTLSPASEFCPSPFWFPVRDTLACRRGGRGSQFGRRRQTLWYSSYGIIIPLCSYCSRCWHHLGIRHQ